MDKLQTLGFLAPEQGIVPAELQFTMRRLGQADEGVFRWKGWWLDLWFEDDDDDDMMTWAFAISSGILLLFYV